MQKLAGDIIEAQVREIGEMENLIANLSSNPVPEDAPDLPPGGGQ